jgi:hypothetical protein
VHKTEKPITSARASRLNNTKTEDLYYINSIYLYISLKILNFAPAKRTTAYAGTTCMLKAKGGRQKHDEYKAE